MKYPYISRQWENERLETQEVVCSGGNGDWGVLNIKVIDEPEKGVWRGNPAYTE